MNSIDYKGRKLTASYTRKDSIGGRKVEVRCNGRFVWTSEYNASPVAELEMAKSYVDEAEDRPAAYPNLAK